jgi:hypothetical protein
MEHHLETIIGSSPVLHLTLVTVAAASKILGRTVQVLLERAYPAEHTLQVAV